MFKRLIAMYIDLMIISFINAPLFYWLITGERSLLKNLLLVLSMVGMVFFKDALNLSVGRRIFKLVVYQYNSEKRATPMQRLIRNIPLICWPVEAIVALSSSSHRRLGDKMAGTIVEIDRSVQLFR